ncbi:MAG: potassium channel family protein [Synergistaceae bacterium]|jgi:voltage-gated potassium channel|nr:potassium channel family protein [Synergistaceae bacterium]
MKMVKGVRRGKAIARKIGKHFLWVVLGFGALLFGSAYLVWHQEQNFQGSYVNALWSVLFTLIGQGEFATNPRTFSGRLIVFVLSIVGVALLGVIFSEIMQRLMASKLRELMGMSRCKYAGHTLICGWNERGRLILRELLAAGKQVAVIASERPSSLANDVYFAAGSPADEEVLSRAGVTDAAAAIILSNPSGSPDDADAKTILTALAVESANHELYSVIELANPDNERHARLAKVDDIIYCDSLIAEITATCAVHAGISVFMRDILCASDQGHRFAAFNISDEFGGKPLGDFFKRLRKDGHLPVGVIAPPKDNPQAPVGLWLSQINPKEDLTVALPMKAVCIVKN